MYTKRKQHMPDTLNLHKPHAGQTTTIATPSNANIALDFAPAEATLSRHGDNLVFTFEHGGTIELSNFYGTVTQQSLPDFVIEGQHVAGADFFAALEDTLQPAAGPATSTAAMGARFYEGVSMELLGGIDALGGLDISNPSGGSTESATDILTSALTSPGPVPLAIASFTDSTANDSTANDSTANDSVSGGSQPPPIVPVVPEVPMPPMPPTPPTPPVLVDPDMRGESVTVAKTGESLFISTGCTGLFYTPTGTTPKMEKYFKDAEGQALSKEQVLNTAEAMGARVNLTGLNFSHADPALSIVDIVNNAKPGTVFYYEGFFRIPNEDILAGKQLVIPTNVVFIVDGVIISPIKPELYKHNPPYFEIVNHGALVVDSPHPNAGVELNGYVGHRGSFFLHPASESTSCGIHNRNLHATTEPFDVEVGMQNIPDLHVNFDDLLHNDTGMLGIQGLLIGNQLRTESGTYTDGKGCTYVVDFDKGNIHITFDVDTFTGSSFGYAALGNDGQKYMSSFYLTLGDSTANVDGKGNFIPSSAEPAFLALVDTGVDGDALLFGLNDDGFLFEGDGDALLFSQDPAATFLADGSPTLVFDDDNPALVFDDDSVDTLLARQEDILPPPPGESGSQNIMDVLDLRDIGLTRQDDLTLFEASPYLSESNDLSNAGSANAANDAQTPYQSAENDYGDTMQIIVLQEQLKATSM